MLRFGYDFMAEFLSILIGIDVLTHMLDHRVFRVIAYCGILAVCTMMIGCVWDTDDSVVSEGMRGSTSLTVELVALWITGVVSAVLFVVLSCTAAVGLSEGNMTRNTMAHTVNAAIGFMLLHSAGLLFYALPGYQILLMLSLAAMIAYEMLFM